MYFAHRHTPTHAYAHVQTHTHATLHAHTESLCYSNCTCSGDAVSMRGNTFWSAHIHASMLVCVRVCLCLCVPSPLDGLLCLVCMVSVPTTAPIVTVVVVAARLCTEACVSVARVLKAGRYAHGLSPSPSTHPPSALSRTPTPIIRSFMLFHATSRCSSFPLPRPPLPLSLSLSLSLLFLSRR